MTIDLRAISAVEYDALKFEANADGLLQRGSPIIFHDLAGRPWGGHAGVVILVVPADNSLLAAAQWAKTWDGPSSLVSLDLTDATGRAHLAWWIARKIQHANGGHLNPSEGVRWHRSWRGYWEMHCQRADEHRRWQEVDFLPWAGDARTSDRNGGPHAVWCRFVPALADLDPNDPRLLPDGSRLVDALALAAVGRHLLAGGGK